MCRCAVPECGESAPFHTSSNMPALRCGCGENINLFKVSYHEELWYLSRLLLCRV